MLVLTEATFDETVGGSELPVVVDFWASWCGPCKALAPVLDGTAAEMADRVVFAKVDVDDCPGLASRFSVMSVPSLLVFKDGELVARLVGARPAGQLRREIEAHL